MDHGSWDNQSQEVGLNLDSQVRKKKKKIENNSRMTLSYNFISVFSTYINIIYQENQPAPSPILDPFLKPANISCQSLKYFISLRTNLNLKFKGEVEKEEEEKKS